MHIGMSMACDRGLVFGVMMDKGNCIAVIVSLALQRTYPGFHTCACHLSYLHTQWQCQGYCFGTVNLGSWSITHHKELWDKYYFCATPVSDPSVCDAQQEIAFVLPSDIEIYLYISHIHIMPIVTVMIIIMSTLKAWLPCVTYSLSCR